MDNEKKKKKTILVIMLVVTLITLFGAATYAYFSIGTTSNFGSKTISTSAEDMGLISIEGTEAALLLDIKATDMMEDKTYTTYFASSSGEKITHNYEEVLGVASVSPNTDTNRYKCSYTLQITHTGTNDMYNAFMNNYNNKSANQIQLIVNHKRYDWNNTLPEELEQEFYIESGDTVNITAGLQFTNSATINQNGLAGKDIALSLKIKDDSLKCEAVNKLPILIDGTNLNIKLKKMAEPENESNITAETYVNTNVTAIKRYTEGTPDSSLLTLEHEVQANDSEKIYAWFNNGTIYFWSESEMVQLNTDSSNAFRQFSNLTDISGLAYMDSSNVNNMQGMLRGNISLTNLTPVANWNTGKVTNMHTLFAGLPAAQMALTDLTPLSNWDVSNVTTMQSLFQCNTSLLDTSPLANWDVSNVTSMLGLFLGLDSAQMHVTNLVGLANWDVSNVTNMQAMFQFNVSLSDLTPLRNWNTSSVTIMQGMFVNSNILSLKPLANWNVSSVNDFSNTFNQTSNSTLTTLEGLEKWNVSSATDMESMFQDGVSLEDVSAINDWDVTGVTNFEDMFLNSKNGIHPEFTKVSGTWSNGTFTKSS